LIFTDAVQ
jgi:hypothetical protein